MISDRGARAAGLVLVAALVWTALWQPAPAAWSTAGPGHPWSFPEDHWPHHRYRTEWWYLTGHLRAGDDPSREFGYQFTIFRVGLTEEEPPGDSAWSARAVVMGHAALTDVGAGVHRFSDVLRRASPLLGGFGAWPDPRIAWVRGPAGTPGTWSLTWNGEAFDVRMHDAARRLSMRLATRPDKPVVLQGPGGVSRKGEDPTAASLYYSLTRLRTAGEVSLDGRTWSVSGVSWMDKEFASSSLGPRQVGWDWASLQLDDGRDLMLYLMRRADGSVDFRNATLVDPSGTPRHLTPGDWSLRATATWTSPRTRAVYPARWLLEIPGDGLSLEILPRLADQENRAGGTAGLFYWEGAVEARDRTGRRVGLGYVELTGYGDDNRPPV
jgi:predicted secreted hydrolase